MGCSGSSEDRRQRPRPAPQIGMPQDVTIHIPRNRADAQGVPIQKTNFEIDSAAMRQALTEMGIYLQQRNAQITAIVVGGAVNTLLLRSRATTHDVDIFGTNLDNHARMLLDEAMQFANQRTGQQLGTDWFNTETQMWMSPQIHRDLTQSAFKQRIVVFQHGGLTLLAAPWSYAFSSKVSRLLTGGSNARPYDLADALRYLDEIINVKNGQPVTLDEAMSWASRYNHDITGNFLLGTVNPKYQQRFGRPGIVKTRQR